jgi:hypothetical protein
LVLRKPDVIGSEFIADDVQHGQGQHAVSAGPERHPLIGLGGGIRAEGVDHHRARSAGAGVGHHLGGVQGNRLGQRAELRPPQHHVIAFFEIDFAVERTVQQQMRDVRRRAAVVGAVPVQVRRAEGRPEGFRDAIGGQIEMGDHQLAGVLGPDFCQAAGDFGQRLVPGNFPPLGVDTDTFVWIAAPHRREQTFRIVEIEKARLALGADVALGVGRQGIADHVGHLAARSANLDAAAIVTTHADRRHPAVLGLVVLGPRLAQHDVRPGCRTVHNSAS